MDGVIHSADIAVGTRYWDHVIDRGLICLAVQSEVGAHDAVGDTTNDSAQVRIGV